MSTFRTAAVAAGSLLLLGAAPVAANAANSDAASTTPAVIHGEKLPDSGGFSPWITGAAGPGAAGPGAAGPGAAGSSASAPSLAGASAGTIADLLGRGTLRANDGWGSATTGTTGGAAADQAHVFTVSTRSQLVAALGGAGNATPKIIFVRGTVAGNVDDADQPLSCADYQRNGYTLDAYLAAFDPAVWGRASEPSGPLEDARVASQKAQAARIQIKVGANTTIVGLATRSCWASTC